MSDSEREDVEATQDEQRNEEYLSDGSESDSSRSEGGDNLEGMDRYWPPPINESLELIGSNSFKTVSSFAFNNAGTRFAAGGHDHELRIWDFEAIDLIQPNPSPICNTQPCGQTVIKSLNFSSDDELVLVISGSCLAVVVEKDGVLAKRYLFPKGDQYITDMAKTKGHVQMMNDGCWNPKDKNSLITCSNDSTIRIWDLTDLSQQKTVIKTRSPISGLRALPNVCGFSRDALSIVAGCNDGSVMLWDTRRKFITTSTCIKNAHLKGSEITGIDFSYGLHKMCSRSADESCKVWDLRKPKDPLACKAELTTIYSTTNCTFSPDDKYILTGTSATEQESGQLLFLDATGDLSVEHSIDMSPGVSVICSKWHPKINHIGYSCSNGKVYMVCDKKRSMGGLLSSEVISSKGTKRKKYVSQKESSWTSSAAKKIITPHALPLFRDDAARSSFAKIRQDPKLSYKPEVPMTGANQGGRVKPAGSTLSSYIARNIAKRYDGKSDENPK